MKHLHFVLFILIPILGFSQDKNIRNLVFEGAGIKGIAYAGVVEAFEKEHLLDDIEKVGGTSAGAIVAMAIALGYTSEEIKNEVFSTNFNQFNDGGVPFFGGMSRFKKYYGWYKGEKFTRWLEKLIQKKTQNADICFKDLRAKGFKDLYLTATCLNQQKLVILSHETYPNMKIKDAIRISMSIPLYFQAVFVDKNGGLVKRPKDKKGLDIFVDGGIIGNYPIHIFDSFVADSLNRKQRITNYQTVGIRMDTEAQINRDNQNQELEPQKIDNLPDYISAFYIFIIENLNRQQLSEEDWKRTISVSSADISPRLKKLSTAQKATLMQNGRERTILFLKAPPQ